MCKQKQTFIVGCSSSSPAGRRNTDADGGGERKRGCSHRAVTADPRAARTQAQPDSQESDRRGVRKICTENKTPTALSDYYRRNMRLEFSEKQLLGLLGLFEKDF